MGSPHSLAVRKYIKNRQRVFSFMCHRENDADLIAFLESKDNRAGYIKDVLRREMEKPR